MSEQERTKIFKKVDVGSLSAWRDWELDVDNAEYVKAFKSLLLQKRGRGADELWDLLRKAAKETDSFKEGDKILQIMQSGTTDCFGLSIEDLNHPVDYVDLFRRANQDNLEDLRDEFRVEIQDHLGTRGVNSDLRQVFNRRSWN